MTEQISNHKSNGHGGMPDVFRQTADAEPHEHQYGLPKLRQYEEGLFYVQRCAVCGRAKLTPVEG